MGSERRSGHPEVDDAALVDAVAETWWRALKP
jgi:hypothetical protein